MARIDSVNIRPGVNVLSVLPHLNYKAWFALAEFVDNAIQSSVARKKQLIAADGQGYSLRVDIDFDLADSRITIRDNAAGIASSDYQRAFRPAEIPPDASGLSEFGMGMKSAACWFAPTWSVRSTALGERVERTVFFDIDKIVTDSIEELDVVSIEAAENSHYTEVRLEKIRKFPHGKTIGKIKEHLASIYRAYIRDGSLALFVDGVKLEFTEPAILKAPYYRDPDGPSLEWRKDIEIDLGDDKIATGFVAIREVASTRLAGLALFRRKRLIFGSADETYRPEDIFGRSNSYAFQRIFGEIHLKGFAVSHTKDGVKWEENEDEFLQKLRKELSGESMPLIQQAREYRSKSGAKVTRDEAAAALRQTAEEFRRTSDTVGDFGNKFASIVGATPMDATDELRTVSATELEQAELCFNFRGEPWIVKIDLSYADDGSDWLEIKNRPSITDPEPREVLIRIAMLHPFMAQFQTLDAEGLGALLKVASSIALAEVAVAELGDRSPSAVRRLTNEILRQHFSQRLIDG